jgi:hypothetical protein
MSGRFEAPSISRLDDSGGQSTQWFVYAQALLVVFLMAMLAGAGVYFLPENWKPSWLTGSAGEVITRAAIMYVLTGVGIILLIGILDLPFKWWRRGRA